MDFSNFQKKRTFFDQEARQLSVLSLQLVDSSENYRIPPPSCELNWKFHQPAKSGSSLSFLLLSSSISRDVVLYCTGWPQTQAILLAQYAGQLEPSHLPASSSITTDNLCNIIYSTSNISPSYIHIIKPIVQVAAANAFNPSTSKAQAGSSPSSKPARSTQRNLVWGLRSGNQQNRIFQPRYGASVTNFRQSLNMLLQSALVVNAFNPSTREAWRADF